MSNDPLLGLDCAAPEQPKSKWVDVPKREPRGGYAEPLRARHFEPSAIKSPEGRKAVVESLRVETHGARAEVKNVSVEGDIVVIAHPPVTIEKNTTPPKQEKLPRAYRLSKPSRLQRLLDWILL